MSDTILAALIAVLGTLLGTVLGAWLTRSSEREKIASEERRWRAAFYIPRKIETTSALYATLSEFFTYAIRCEAAAEVGLEQSEFSDLIDEYEPRARTSLAAIGLATIHMSPEDVDKVHTLITRVGALVSSCLDRSELVLHSANEAELQQNLAVVKQRGSDVRKTFTHVEEMLRSKLSPPFIGEPGP